MITAAHIHSSVRGLFFFAFFNTFFSLVCLYPFFTSGAPFRSGMNEFHSFLWLALFLLTVAAGKYSMEQKRISLNRNALILFLISGATFLLLYVFCRFQGALWTSSALLPSAFIAGMCSALFVRLTPSREKLHLYELGGATLSALLLFSFTDRISGRPVFLLLTAAFFFFTFEVLLFLFPLLMKKRQRYLFVFFISLLLILLLYSFLVSVFLCCVRSSSEPLSENDFIRQIAVVSGLQPDKRAIRVLLLSPPGTSSESVSTFPLTNKFTLLPLSDSADPFTLLGNCPFNYDLILMIPPEPGTFSANRLYTPDFFLTLRNHLSPDGVLGVVIPEFSGARYRRDRLFEIRGIVAATLRRVFPKVRLSPGGSYLLLCGGENVSNDLQELNERAGKLLSSSDYLPDNLMLLLNTPEEMDQKNRSFSEYSVTAKENQSFPPPLLTSVLRGMPEIDLTPLGAVSDFYRRSAVFWGGWMIVFWLLMRYFLSGGLKKKRTCLTFENGFFAGGVFASALLLAQIKSTSLYSDGWLLAAIFFFFTFWGLAASGGNPVFSRAVYLFSALLPLLTTGAFLFDFPGEEQISFAAMAATGFCLGLSAGEIQGYSSHLFFGFSFGILLLILSVFPFYGLWFCAGILVLTRIPGIVTKNMKKEFEFSRLQPKIPE